MPSFFQKWKLRSDVHVSVSWILQCDDTPEVPPGNVSPACVNCSHRATSAPNYSDCSGQSKLKSSASVESSGMPPWAGLIEAPPYKDNPPVKYCQINGLNPCCVDRLSRQPLPDISNSVGPVKYFLSRLRRSLRRVVFVVRFVRCIDDHGSFGSLSVGFGPT